MAKVTAPILSLGASGSISKSVTFSRWKGVAYAKVHVTPENPNTADQQEVRGVFATLTEMWKRMDNIARAPWETAVQGKPLTPRNRHIQANLAALQGEADLNNLVMSVASGQALPPENVVPADGGAQTLNITGDAPTAPVGYTATALLGLAIEDGDPSPIYIATIYTGTGGPPPWSIDLEVQAAGTYQWGTFLCWTRNADGTYFYSTAVRGQQVIA